MRTLDEQWVEEDRHMYKAVGFPQYGCVLCNGCHMAHGSDQREEKKAWCQMGDDFLPFCNFGNNFVVHDLGPVNEDGCLAEGRTGLFPRVKQDGPMWFVEMHTSMVNVLCIGGTKQQAIDAWNWRN